MATQADNSNVLTSNLTGQLGSSVAQISGVMELSVTGLGTKNPQTDVQWLGSAATSGKTLAGTTALPNFLDIAPLVTSTIDIAGMRYIATTIKVRNAPACASPGSCTPYTSARQNVTFFAVMMPGTINQTAVSRFRRFDGSDANPALTAQLLPAHGLNAFGNAVEPGLASFMAYRESELPTADAGVTSVLPYGFVVKNVNDGGRVLPASPASGQYDGVVTFGFRIPLQTNATDDPFRISLRFQTADDNNLRVTQSFQEQSFAGDLAASARAFSLSGNDLVVLGGRVAQTTIGDPICRVRIAGTAVAPTGFLVNNLSATPMVVAAPMNLSFVDRTSEVSLGLCDNVAAPTAATLVVHGSQSGLRKVGAAYGGVITGGSSSNRPNQMIWNLGGGARPFFAGEEVSFVATAGNTRLGDAAPITPFAGSFRVKGANAGSSGGFAAPNILAVGTLPRSVAMGDANGDGLLDIVLAQQFSNNVAVRLGDGAGGFLPAAAFAVPADPISAKFADMNADGVLDIVVASTSANNVSVLIGNGSGGFGPAASHAVGTTPFALVVGDMNADGRLDLVSANYGANTVSILLANGRGGFMPSITYSVGANPTAVALADLNGDGRLDIVTSNYGANSVSVLLGTGFGGFSLAGNIAVGTWPYGVAIGDVNGDGRPDVVSANAGSSNVSALLGNGAGGFAAAANYAAGNFAYALTLADLNGDGRLDVVVANVNANNVSILSGNGAGGFSAPSNIAVGTEPSALAIGDLNGDGRLDLVTANPYSATASVFLGL